MLSAYRRFPGTDSSWSSSHVGFSTPLCNTLVNFFWPSLEPCGTARRLTSCVDTLLRPSPMEGFSTRRRVPGLVVSTALYVFPIFVSYRSGRTHVSSFTRIADKRQVENSALLAILAQLPLSHCFGSFNSCLD